MGFGAGPASAIQSATAGQMGAGSTAGNAGQLMSISGTIGAVTESATYTYDNLSRLVTSNQTTNASSAQRRFTYDRWANRTGVWDATSGGNQIQSIALQQSGGVPTNRITSVTSGGSTLNYVYDSAGNVTNDGVHSYAYDSENRLVSVAGGSTATYAYDQSNQRYKKTVGSSVTHCIWQGSQVIAEHNGSTGASIADYVYSGSRMIAKVAGLSTQYFLSDRLSARLVLNTSGNVIGRQGHLPFGEDFGESGTQEKHHFTSYERDGESGTDYSVNRQYGQSVGRFMRVDPLASSARLEAPQSWNRYSYVLNEPVDQVDPLGLEENPEYCPPWLQSCDHLIPGSSGFSGGVSYDPGAGPYEGRPRSPVVIPPQRRAECAEQDFHFSEDSGNYLASELEALAQMAVGEAGAFRFSREEVEAAIASAVNRQNYNIAYYFDHSRPHFGENAPTQILDILEDGYVAHRRQSGAAKVDGQKAINFARYGINKLLEGDVACDQLKVAKRFARLAGTLSVAQIFSMYPVTFNHAGISYRPPRGSRNILRYGSTTFWNGDFGPPAS